MTRAFVIALLVLCPVPALAQLQALPYATGLSAPIEIVQDPVIPSVQYVVQQRGRVRVVINGIVQAQDFLDLTGQMATGFEQGLLGLAFDPGYAVNRRFYINFTNLQGHTVVRRYTRSLADPLLADAGSGFDLQWGGASGIIVQPFQNHNGGHLEFGPDGYLYVALGDGGSGGDPQNHAQNMNSLLGKILRIDVDVPDDHTWGYTIPADNPFASGGGRPEIWSVGWRNPWKFTFDKSGAGGPGTGAMTIGDVGQSAFEELNYEPANAAGRNYGWRLYEGNAPYLPDTEPAFLPLRFPMIAYDRDVGGSVTGGYVYRGSALGAAYFGRYFYADWSAGRVWSVELTIDPDTGEATAGTPVEHTAEFGGTPVISNISAFGVDSDGELFLVRHCRQSEGCAASGAVFRIVRAGAPGPGVNIIGNGAFNNGLTGWSTFATPDPSYIVADVVNGDLRFYRVPPPPGQSNQAVVFQQTGVEFPSGAPMELVVSLGNSNNTRKRISVLLHDADFSDLAVCTFWLPPHTVLTTYRVRTHTTQAWTNATVSFYAATEGSDVGTYRIDNVSLAFVPALSAQRTECVDPFAPSSSGADGPELLANGDFSSGLPPWGLFGQIVNQVNGGVLEFYRPAGQPAGVVLQNTGQLLALNEVVTATFRFGNSSGVRKRVTVLLHAGDFTDLSACTFWLSPGQPLMDYAMRTYATQSWTNATISIYGATTGTEQWTRVDDVSFRRTPGAATAGTTCVEPGGAFDGASMEQATGAGMGGAPEVTLVHPHAPDRDVRDSVDGGHSTSRQPECPACVRTAAAGVPRRR
jgi:glucose/arabinose dehydrogenase